MLTALLSTIVSLTIIEVLLSIDNALVNATIAESLPEEKRKKALRIGIILGALFRVVALLLAAYIIKNDWIKILGGLYLVYLFVEHIGREVDAKGKEIKHHTSYKRVIFEIALADIVFSLDNVISAVSFSNNIAIVILGVLIGTISMLVITPFVSTIIHKHKSLGTAAYVIVAFIGSSLILETLTSFHIEEFVKFLVILGILGIAYMYEKDTSSRRVLAPIFKHSANIIGLPYDIIRVVKGVIFGK